MKHNLCDDLFCSTPSFLLSRRDDSFSFPFLFFLFFSLCLYVKLTSVQFLHPGQEVNDKKSMITLFRTLSFFFSFSLFFSSLSLSFFFPFSLSTYFPVLSCKKMREENNQFMGYFCRKEQDTERGREREREWKQKMHSRTSCPCSLIKQKLSLSLSLVSHSVSHSSCQYPRTLVLYCVIPSLSLHHLEREREREIMRKRRKKDTNELWEA